MVNNLYITPDWPAPKQVRAFTTTRRLDKKLNGYSSFNLATHVGDDPAEVENNRQTLQHELNLTKTPHWLNQTHGNDVIELPNQQVDADASFTSQANTICAILTADCLPLLLCNRRGNKVAAVHAGWRGLYNDIVEKTVDALQEDPADIFAWLGPAISQTHYEINQSLYEKFIALNLNFSSAFQQTFAIRS